MLSEDAAAAARRAAEPKFLASDSDTRQDWTALAAHLDEHGFRFDPKIDTPRQFSGGFGNLNYLVQVDGAPMVLRRCLSASGRLKALTGLAILFPPEPPPDPEEQDPQDYQMTDPDESAPVGGLSAPGSRPTTMTSTDDDTPTTSVRT